MKAIQLGANGGNKVRQKLLATKQGASARNWRFYLKLVITYLAPILLLPLIVFRNSRKTRCAYVILLVFANWLSRTLPLGVTALMPLVYLPALRILPYENVLSEYMNNTVLLTLAAIAMSIGIETTQLHHRIALWVLLKFGQSLHNIMLGYTVATFAITLVLKNSATLDILVPVVDATVHEIHYTYIRSLYQQHVGVYNDRKLSVSCMARAMQMTEEQMSQITTKFIKIRKVLLITVAYTAMIGSTGALSGTVTNYVAKMVIETKFPKNTDLTFMLWTAAFLPGALIEVAVSFVVLYHVHMRRLGSEKVVLVVFAVVILLWCTRKPIFFKGWENLIDIHTIDDTSIAFMAVAVLFAVPMTGADIDKRILSWNVVCHKMAWGMLLTFGGGLALAQASEACGLQLNPLYLVFPVTLSVTQACILPASCSVIAIIADEGHVTVKDIVVPGIVVKFTCQMVNALFLNTLGNYVFKLSEFPDWAENCTYVHRKYHH